jgi:hypothetical protein
MKKSLNIKEFLYCKSKCHETKPMHPSSLRAFQIDPERNLKHPSLVDPIHTKQNKTKQNKQTTLLHVDIFELKHRVTINHVK